MAGSCLAVVREEHDYQRGDLVVRGVSAYYAQERLVGWTISVPWRCGYSSFCHKE